MAARARSQRVRIIGGRWRRRLLAFPALDDLRPTPDRVRETVFNWLGQDLDGLVCLDLFAGSGALGFEAASRGARRVVMVEHDLRAIRGLEANRDLLLRTPLDTPPDKPGGPRRDAQPVLRDAPPIPRDALPIPRDAPRIEIVKADVQRFLEREGERAPGAYDLVFVDPPYRLELLPTLLPRLVACVAPAGLVYVEQPCGSASVTVEPDAAWTTVRRDRAGAVDYRLLKLAAVRTLPAQPDVNPDTLSPEPFDDALTHEDGSR